MASSKGHQSLSGWDMRSPACRAVLGILCLSFGLATVVRGGDRPAGTAARSGIDLQGFDRNVRPQDDFFRHVNGAWLGRVDIPPDRSYYGSFVELIEKSEADLHAIALETSQAIASPGSDTRKIGDLFASFMDEEGVQRRGLQPIAEDLKRIAAVRDMPGLLHLIAELQRDGVGGLFGISINTDDKQSDRYILSLVQSGISLPDEAYYRDPKFQPIRQQFAGHLERMLALAGVPSPQAAARSVLIVETELAKHHWDRVKRRDRTLSYNKKDRHELEAMVPGVDWRDWLQAYGAREPEIHEVIVRQPDFFTALSPTLGKLPLDHWKNWLTWHLLHRFAPYLGKPFVDEDFAFFGKVLTGAPELRPRWKRGVALVGEAMGEAVGRIYVSRRFPPAARSRMQQLVANLIDAYHDEISSLEWMGPETRERALEKLAKFHPKIGYPDKWRDYSKLVIHRDDLLGNFRRSVAFEVARHLAKLGQPVDRDEWHMTPQTVNAYYNPGMNEIVFPAAILQPPFFNMAVDDAVNYGGIGAVIGHEIGHGFDDQGSKSDGNGNMVSWWTDADRKEFDGRTRRLIDQYGGFEPSQLRGQRVNGAMTIGENIGDLGGLSIAYKAYKRSLKGQQTLVIDGLTGEQRFFVGWAQVWRSKYRDAELSRRLATDPHSPPEFRCNGVLRNLPEFYSAFGVKPGDRLWLPPEQRVRIW